MEVKAAASGDFDTKFPPLTSCFSHILPAEHVEAESPCGSSRFQAGHLPSHTPHLRRRPWDLVLVRALYRSRQLEECLLFARKLPELPAEVHCNPAGGRAGGHVDVESDQGSVRNNLLLLESETAAGCVAVSRAGG